MRAELLEELRSLRRSPGPFGLDRIAKSEALTDFVGRGSTEQAYSTLLDVLARDGADPDGDIRAFFETSGHEREGRNLDERLSSYAAARFIDKRTALRRSDRGAEQLSYILRDAYLYERPWANLIVRQHDDLVTAKVAVEIPEYTQWRRPHVYINGVFQPDREFELHDSDTHPMLVSGVETFPDVALRLDDPEGDLFELRVVWVMPVWPSWQSGAHLTNPDYYAKLVNNRDHSAEVSVCRLDGA